jgi:hypothetical protein
VHNLQSPCAHDAKTATGRGVVRLRSRSADARSTHIRRITIAVSAGIDLAELRQCPNAPAGPLTSSWVSGFRPVDSHLCDSPHTSREARSDKVCSFRTWPRRCLRDRTRPHHVNFASRSNAPTPMSILRLMINVAMPTSSAVIQCITDCCVTTRNGNTQPTWRGNGKAVRYLSSLFTALVR